MAPFSLTVKATDQEVLWTWVLRHLPCHLSNLIPITLLSPSLCAVGKLLLYPSCCVIVTTPVRAAEEGSWPQSADGETGRRGHLACPGSQLDTELRPGAGVLDPHDPPCCWPLLQWLPVLHENPSEPRQCCAVTWAESTAPLGCAQDGLTEPAGTAPLQLQPVEGRALS